MSKKRLALIIITLVLVTFPSATLAQGETVPQAVSGEEIPCPMPLAPGDIDGETIICGQIQVPENWDDPDSPLITLTYARLLSYNLSPIADPIIFFAGGPGGSVLASQGSFGFDFSYLRETRDVIVWDQRGNRYSADLLCPPEVVSPDVAARDAAYQAFIAESPQFSLALDPLEILDLTREKMEILGKPNCADYLAAEGQDVAQYKTDSTVRDAIALMDHLGYPSYNLFGISYGTRVTLAIMEYYGNNPDAALPPVRSALIDGVYPRNIPGAEEVMAQSYNVLRVFADCEADEACGAAYPDIRQGFIDLLASLEDAPVTGEDGTEVTLDDMLNVLSVALPGKNFELIPYLPRMVDELSRGETTTYSVVNGIMNDEIPAVLPAVEAQLTNPLAPLTSQASVLAAQMRALADQVDGLGETTGALAIAIDEAETLPQLFSSLFTQSLLDITPEERSTIAGLIVANFVDYPARQNRAGLLQLTEIFPDIVANELTAVVNLMTDADVSDTWAELTAKVNLDQLQFSENNTNLVVKCNDTGPGYDLEQAFERWQASEAPQLFESSEIANIEVVSTIEVNCEIFGLAADEFAVAPPVTSDIRTLVMNGAVDHATPVEWGELAFETLTNAIMVTVPMTDHGVTRYHKCTQDIAHTFFLYPDSELDMSCVDALRPVFVLPDDELPGVAAE